MGCFQVLKLRRLFKAMVSSVDHVMKSIFGSMAGTREFWLSFSWLCVISFLLLRGVKKQTCQKGLKENVFQQQFTKKSPTRKSPIFPPRDFHPNLGGFSSQRFVSEHLRVRYVKTPKVCFVMAKQKEGGRYDMSKLGCVYEGDFFYFLPMVNHH